jgi:hypothetical protein
VNTQENKDKSFAECTKREIFAMHAMQSLATNTGYGSWKDLASDAVSLADAVLVELEK